MTERLRRTVLMSNRMEWTAEQVVGGYGGQQPVAKIFRGLKDGDLLNRLVELTGGRQPAICELVG
jgi:hypothetical protein